MSLQLIDLIKGQLGPAMITQAASQYGESENTVSAAVNALVPVVIAALAENAHNPAVIKALKDAPTLGFTSNLLTATSTPFITDVEKDMFAGKRDTIVSTVAGFSNIKESSASHLLNAATGAALATAGKYAESHSLDDQGIVRLLEQQKDSLAQYLPAGFNYGNTHTTSTHTEVPAAAATSAAAASASRPVAEPVKTVHEDKGVHVTRSGNTHAAPEKSGGSIWKWIITLALLGILAYFFFSRNEHKDPNPAVTDSTIVNDSGMVNANDTAATAAPKKDLVDIDLNGKKLKGLANGMESKLIEFLKSAEYNHATDDVLKDKWFDFDNITFVFGSANQLEPGSEVQLQNVADILKAYPDAKIKIGGYTDKKGDAAVNKKLSQDRADYLKSELTKLGVGSQISGAEGYGSEFATVPADKSDSERSIDRKMAVRFQK